MPIENLPLTGLKGIRENWRNDVIASLSVALVALPLCLGIAVASGVAPMSGILSAIIGGVVRDGEGQIALGDFEIQSGDRVVVCCQPQSIGKVEKLFV